LIDDKKYDEARKEVENELRLLAESLGGSTNERLTMLKSSFNAFLPEAIRSSLNANSSKETKGCGEKMIDANKPDGDEDDLHGNYDYE
jgi:hypothetical protein